MKSNKNLRSNIFLIIITVYISSTTTNSIGEVFRGSYCQMFENVTTQDISKPGKNSFTVSQIKNYLKQNGFSNIKRLRLDDKGIWRALVEFKKCHFLISVDYSGAIHIQNESNRYD
ncbi:hypothetical protein [Bartonella sp. B30(2025)]